MRAARAIALPLLAGCLLVACGGSDDKSAKGPLGSESNPVPALPNPSATRTPPTDRLPGESAANPRTSDGATPGSASAPKSRSTRTQHGTVSKRPAASSTTSARKQKALPASASRPCSLVTKRQAKAIVGAPILEPLQAPQGPTCIYQTRSGKPYITLAVQRVNFPKLRKQVRNEHAVPIARRTGYCGTYGTSMLFLPVGNGRVLSIAAPCAMAQRFAAKAAAHL